MSIKDALDKISRQSGLGSLTSAASNNLWGINHRGAGNPIPTNKDSHGLTFFTRPRMNLSYDNIAVDRILTPMLDGQGLASTTYQRAIRVLLDPFGADTNDITSPLVDNKQAFIPILSNLLLSCSGWPDPSVDTFTSKAGNYQEAWSMVDSVVDIYRVWSATCNFKNIEGDPISLIFNTWLRYMSGVYQGTMVPYPDAVVENEIDYNTRIYRLVLDPSRQWVQKIMACGAAFPLNVPLGAAANFSSDAVFNTDNDQISINFQCMGATYLDPILIDEFNWVVQEFNSDMADGVRESIYHKLTPEEATFFNYRGYPHIGANMELEWWVEEDDYAEYASRNDFKAAAAAYATLSGGAATGTITSPNSAGNIA